MQEINNASAQELISEYQSDPVRFMVECLDVKQEHVWSKMREVAESIRDNQLTAVKAGHSVSKTYTAARIVLWFLYCYGPLATVITTAPTDKQVSEILWRDINLAHSQAKLPLGGKISTKKLEQIQNILKDD